MTGRDDEEKVREEMRVTPTPFLSLLTPLSPEGLVPEERGPEVASDGGTRNRRDERRTERVNETNRSAPLVGSRFGRSSFTYSPLTAFGSRKEWSETRRCRGERMIRPGGPRAKIQK